MARRPATHEVGGACEGSYPRRRGKAGMGALAEKARGLWLGEHAPCLRFWAWAAGLSFRPVRR